MYWVVIVWTQTCSLLLPRVTSKEIEKISGSKQKNAKLTKILVTDAKLWEPHKKAILKILDALTMIKWGGKVMLAVFGQLLNQTELFQKVTPNACYSETLDYLEEWCTFGASSISHSSTPPSDNYLYRLLNIFWNVQISCNFPSAELSNTEPQYMTAPII